MSIQDEFQVNQKLTLTGNLRYDHYNDIKDAISPRVAAVYRLNEHHILKFQYSKAFRPPSFWEMYSSNNPIGAGNPDLESMTNETSEIGYIYKGLNTVFRTTLFYSVLDDVIYLKNSRWENGARNHYWGTELEMEQQLGNSLKLDTNLSYVHTEEVDTVSEGVQAAAWLANMGLIYQPASFLNLALQYRYVGERGREQLDPRGDLDAYQTVGFTVSLFDLVLKGLIVRAGIKNLFDEDVRHPVPLEEFDPTGNRYPAYPDDFPRAGRHWWGQVAYLF